MRNSFILENISIKLFSVLAKDYITKNYSISNTVRIATLLVLNVNARVLIIKNIDISDRLIIEQRGTFKHIETKEKISINCIFSFR